jgi:hypothetical protein
MIDELTKLATHLDAKGLGKEADYLDAIIKKMADDGDLKPNPFMPRLMAFLRDEAINANKARETDGLEYDYEAAARTACSTFKDEMDAFKVALTAASYNFVLPKELRDLAKDINTALGSLDPKTCLPSPKDNEDGEEDIPLYPEL